jgi:uncharacterized membrane protein
MKKSILFIVVLSIFCSFVLSANDGDKKTRLAILPFSTNGGVDKVTMDVMFGNFAISMVNSGIYDVIDGSQLDNAITKLKLNKKKVLDDSSAVEIGKMAGAKIVILINFNFVNKIYYVNLRGIDVTTGIVIFGKSEEAIQKKDLINLVNKLASSITGSIAEEEQE